MAIQDYKVSEAYSGRDIASLSDRPNQDGITAAQLKARFDQLGKEVIPKFNDLIDLLSEGQIEAIMTAYEEGSFDGASIVSAEFVGNDIVFTKDNSETVTLSNAKLDLKGDVGASIISGEFIGNDIVFTKDDDETVTLPNAKLELQGEQGVPGASFTILGRFDTLLDLQTAHPTGEVGEHWSVGTVEPYDVYVWNPDIEDWDNIGQISPSNDASGITYNGIIDGYLVSNVEEALDAVDTSLAGKANSTHTHVTSDVTGLDTALSGKAPISHTHTIANITSLQDALDSKQPNLASGTNIKTINGNSILGSGDLTTATYTVYTATIPYTSWTGSSAPYSKAVTVTGILSTDEPIIDLVLTGTYATDVTMRTDWAKIYRGVTSANTVTFYADSVPTADISIQLVVVR